MNYPFLYQVYDQINIQDLKQKINPTPKVIPVWDDWFLQEIESEYLSDYVQRKFPHLELFMGKFFLSIGTNSNWHIDRYHYFHLTHRILIPFEETFHYEWYVKNEYHQFQPRAGQVILMNNMIPHRFVLNKNSLERRQVVYFDLIDPALKGHLKYFDGDNSIENGVINQTLKK